MSATERTLFTGVRIFDGTGSDAFEGEVLLEGDRIVQVGRAPGTIATDARAIDGRGATLMPGLVECHAHITYPNAVDRFYPHLYPPAAVETTLMTVHNARVLLDHGFTSAYSAGAIKPGIETKLRAEIDAGRIAGPRLRTASMEVYFPGDPDARPMPKTDDELRAFVRESKDEGVDIIKLFLSGLDNVLEQNDWEMVLSDDAVALTAREATEHGMWLSCHVRPVAGLKQALRNGFRVLYHVEEVDDEALDLMEQRKGEIFVGPTIGGIALRAETANGATRETAERRLSAYRETVDRIRARGVRVVPFGDYGFPGRPHGHNARDLGYFVRYLGFRPAEVLAAATKWGGELMARDRYGLIAPGYVADLLLVDGDPTADVRVLEDPAKLLAIVQAGAFRKAPSSAGYGSLREPALGMTGGSGS
jgi:imidazolonepropionase-like amidohydrolase